MKNALRSLWKRKFVLYTTLLRSAGTELLSTYNVTNYLYNCAKCMFENLGIENGLAPHSEVETFWLLSLQSVLAVVYVKSLSGTQRKWIKIFATWNTTSTEAHGNKQQWCKARISIWMSHADVPNFRPLRELQRKNGELLMFVFAESGQRSQLKISQKQYKLKRRLDLHWTW